MKKIKWIIAHETREDWGIATKIFEDNNVPLEDRFSDPARPDFWQHVESKDLPIIGDWEMVLAINLATKEVRLYTK